ncbi:MAG: tRNA adenosine(34) deaminase TadA [Acidimicrobiia bacterium]|nr:tRNA adenosine(34) deaminase TadA [Acidimicrobiia bacterium]
MSNSSYREAMNAALDQARQAGEAGDVPVGAVLLDKSGMIVAADHNRREALRDPTAHAEMLVLSRRAREIESWRLVGHTLVVTLEPCAMCAGASVLSRLDRIVYGAADLKAGAVWSLYNIPQDRRLNHRVDVVEGILEEECASLLKDYFTERR